MHFFISLILTLALTAFGVVLVSLIIGIWPAWIDGVLLAVAVVGGALGIAGAWRSLKSERSAESV